MATQTFPFADVPLVTGSNITPSVNVPSGFTQVVFQIDFTAFLPTDTITLELQFSTDSGVTWIGGGGIGTNGGVHHDKLGNVVLAGFTAFLPAVTAGKALKARVSVTITSAGTVSGTITVS
jgi:hypothetical protein